MDFGTLVEDQQVQDSTLVGKYCYQELMNMQISWMMLLENQKHITLDQQNVKLVLRLDMDMVIRSDSIMLLLLILIY